MVVSYKIKEMTQTDIIEWVTVNILGLFMLFVKLDKALIIVNIFLALVLIAYNLIRIKQMLNEERRKKEEIKNKDEEEL